MASDILGKMDAKNIQVWAAAGAGVLVLLLYSWRSNTPPKVVEEKYQGGEAYADPKKVVTGTIDDLKAMGSPKKIIENIGILLELAKEKGVPIDDRKLLMERTIALTGSLPATSKNRVKLTDTLIDALWNSLQHPPLSYMGDKFQYRSADGSYNNVLNPNLGKAKTPYAKTVKSEKKLHGCRPDPGLLFDLLMARDEGTFKKNPAGLSSMLFYHATIIIHDIFRTNRIDSNISDTSSYLDLAPLYGSSVEDQMKVRTGSRGLLHPDTYHEERLIAQPPGVNVILVMYSRFHNYVADILLKINEKNRFPVPPKTCTEEERARLEKKLDEDLFQTARLIVGGLYVNISLHDYLRGLTNTHHSNSSWTLDPRVAIDKHFGEDGAPRGIGNQVSAEFNMLYRFHPIISERDEKWLIDFLSREVFPKATKPLSELTAKELIEGLITFEKKIPEQPKERTFGGLHRNQDGTFNDADLVRILKESIEDPAGLFGARTIPKALRVVEILGIIQARKWQLASLNEFRDFFGLKRHETMEDINPDPHIADTLRALYDHPDMVELYPGLFIEDAKPAMNPGCGGCPPYSVGRAVFSDAVTLIRSDRFYTLDYTPATLTNWGMEEVQQDYNTLGGSMFYKLIQRAFPGWFPFNSIYVMQPMFTPSENQEIAKEIGTIQLYSLDPPKAPPALSIVTSHVVATALQQNKQAFRVPWLKGFNEMLPGQRNFASYMLSGDAESNLAQRKLVQGLLYKGRDAFTNLLLETVVSHGKKFLNQETLFGSKLDNAPPQIDILRDVAIPVNTRILADLFALDLLTQENPRGSLNTTDLYTHLLNVRIWTFNNNDPAMAWRRRAWAAESTKVLTQTTKQTIQGIYRDVRTETLLGFFFSPRSARPDWSKKDSLRHYGRDVVKGLLASGKTVDEVVDISWMTALAGVGVCVSVFAEVLGFFLRHENMAHWGTVQKLVEKSKNPGSRAQANQQIRDYILEAQRLSSAQRNLRVCAVDTVIQNGDVWQEIKGVKYAPGTDILFKAGDVVVCLLGEASRDGSAVPNPLDFQPGQRPKEAYGLFGAGPHECLGREIALTYVEGMIKVCAGLKNLRQAPGMMGICKSIEVNRERVYLNNNWSWLTFDPTTWKLHFDGEGLGVWDSTAHETGDLGAEWDVDQIRLDLARKYAAGREAGPGGVSGVVKDGKSGW